MSEPFDYERNCLSYWQPRLEKAGVPTPRTTIIRAEHDLSTLLDGVRPDGWDEFHALVAAACYDHGLPCFLRTGQGSGKHQWSETCFVTDAEKIDNHIGALVEWSHLADIMGLPYDVWAVRDLIQTDPLFRCRSFGGFPVTTEFRVFMRDDTFEHLQPYWPPDAVAEGDPDNEDWRTALAAASELSDEEWGKLGDLAGRAVGGVGGGYWSVDFLRDSFGDWWLTDMALGERSFKWEVNPR